MTSLGEDMRARTALLLGRLQMGMAWGGDSALRMFAMRLVRETLVAGLRAEGHEVSDDRFEAWFSGLRTLSDQPTNTIRPARAICKAILIELGNNEWELLARSALLLQRGFLAPGANGEFADQDDPWNSTSGEQFVAANRLLESARKLLDSIGFDDTALPYPWISRLYDAAESSVEFARPEMMLRVIGDRTVESWVAGISTWALDTVVGAYMSRKALHYPIPLPGLIVSRRGRRDLEDWDEDESARYEDIKWNNVHNAIWRVHEWLMEAAEEAVAIDRAIAHRRSSSRARELAELMTSFGSLTGKQISLMLETTRVGSDIVVRSLDSDGLLARSSGAFEVRRFKRIAFDGKKLPDDQDEDHLDGPLSAALTKFDEDMADIDRLLSRTGRSWNDEP